MEGPACGGSTNLNKINFVNERDDEAKSFHLGKDSFTGGYEWLKQTELCKLKKRFRQVLPLADIKAAEVWSLCVRFAFAGAKAQISPSPADRGKVSLLAFFCFK